VNGTTLANSSLGATGWDKWDFTLNVEAEKYDNISGYTKIDDRQHDYFDAIRSALQRNYDPKTGRGAGVDAFSAWYSDWYGETITSATNLVGFHRYLFVDFLTLNGVPYLVAQNSYGEGIGNKGYHLFSREVINWEFSQRGRSLKTLAILTPAMLAESRKETPLAMLIRKFIRIFSDFSDTFGRV
jgi:hypothetical protein